MSFWYIGRQLSSHPRQGMKKSAEAGQKLHNFSAPHLFTLIMQVFADQRGTATSPTGYRPHRMDHSRRELYPRTVIAANPFRWNGTTEQGFERRSQ